MLEDSGTVGLKGDEFKNRVIVEVTPFEKSKNPGPRNCKPFYGSLFFFTIILDPYTIMTFDSF